MSLIEKIKVKLVDDYHVAAKWWSVRFMAGGAVLSGIAVGISYASTGVAFEKWLGRLTLPFCFLIFLCGLLSRLIKQGPSE